MIQKKKIIIYITAIVLILTVSIISITIFIAHNSSPSDEELINLLSNRWKWENNVRDFDMYINDYQRIANYVYSEYEKNPHDNYGFAIHKSNRGKYDIIDDEYNKSSKELPNSDEIDSSLKAIVEKSFQHGDGSDLDYIKVYKNRVYFITVNGMYSLIYTKDGEKPTFVIKPTENGSTNFEKIDEYWYQGAIRWEFV